MKQFGIVPTDVTISTAMISALVNKAINGDVNACRTCVDLADGKGDKKREHNILKADLELKKLEIKQKEKELSPDSDVTRVIIVNDLDKLQDQQCA